MVEFQVLGPIEAISHGSRLDLGGPTQRALLAILVLEANEVVATDTIVTTLWADDVPRSAVGIVRTYVWRLRQVLGDASAGVALRSRAPGYVLEVDPGSVDAHRFRTLASEARYLLDASRADDALDSSERALALWRGEVLADLDGFDGLRPALVRLDQMRQTVLEDRADAKLALGQHVQIVDELSALTRQQPYRERRWGQLMLALYRSGRQTDALAAYQQVRSILVAEIGVEPGPDLRHLERRILDQDDSLVWRAGPTGALASVLSTGTAARPVSQETFVGRVAELESLVRCLDGARRGELSVALLAGPPGIGKSALARRVSALAADAGLTVLSGRVDEDAGVPCQPISEVIGQWFACAPAGTVDRLDRDAREPLVRIVPALAGDQVEPVPPSPVGDDERRLLFDAITRWMRVAGSVDPVLIVIEDAHWADASSLLALRHVVRHPPDTGVVLLVTYRDTDVDGSDQLAELLTVARREPFVHDIRLGGLGDEEVAGLLRSWTDDGELGDAGVGFSSTLARTTGGNPLFIVETVRHLIEHEAIEPAAGRWVTEPLENFGVPSVVTDVISRRLDELPPASRALLETASVLGEHFELAVLARMASMSSLDAMDALEPAIAAQLIACTGSFGSRFRFTHSLVRHAILDQVRQSHRTRLHWQAGEAIRDLYGGDVGPRSAEIAHHLAAGVHAGDARVAIETNVQAGESALSALAFEDAFERFTTATQLLEGTGVEDERLAYDAWMGVGASSRLDLERECEAFRRAATIARQHGWHDLLARAVIGFSARIAGHRPSHPSQPMAAALVDEALDALHDAPPSLDHCVLLAVLTARAVVAGQARRAIELADQAEQLANAVDDRGAHVAAAGARCWALLGSPDPNRLAAALERGTQPVGDLGHHLLVRFYMLAIHAVPAMQLGDRAEFLAARDQVLIQAETRGTRFASVIVSFWDAADALASGRVDDYRRLAKERPHDPTQPVWKDSAEVQRGLAWLDRVPAGDLVPSFTAFVESTPSAAHGHALLALLHATAGDREAAGREIETLIRKRQLDELGWGAPSVLRYLAEAVARIDAPRLAGQLLPVLSPYAGQLLVSYTGITIDAAADRAIGQLLLTLGGQDAAVDRFVAARALEASFGAEALAARTGYWHALALRRRDAPGDGQEAGALAQRADADARRLGLDPLTCDPSRQGGS